MVEPLAPQPPCSDYITNICASYARFHTSIANALKKPRTKTGAVPTRPSTAQSRRRSTEHAVSESSADHRSTGSPGIPRLSLPSHPKRLARRSRASPATAGTDAPVDLRSWDASPTRRSLSPQRSPGLHPELQLFVPDCPLSESEAEAELHDSSVSNFAPDSVLRRSLSLTTCSNRSAVATTAPRRTSMTETSSGLGSDVAPAQTPASTSNGVGMRHARSLKARRSKLTATESRTSQPFKTEAQYSAGASRGVLRVEGVCQVSRNLGLVEVEALGHEPHVVTRRG